jgi:hypothetical protein
MFEARRSRDQFLSASWIPVSTSVRPWRKTAHGQFFNLFNHPQATPESVNDVTPASTSITTASRNFLQPSNPALNDIGAFFSGNPHTIQVVGRFIFYPETSSRNEEAVVHTVLGKS